MRVLHCDKYYDRQASGTEYQYHLLISSLGRDVFRSRRRIRLRKWLTGALVMCPLLAREPLADRIAHNDPTKYHLSKAVHDGAGQMHYAAMFDEHSLDTNLFFLHRGVIDPKSGIGDHFPNQCEEMFVIFEAEAQFTTAGRTSVVKGPGGPTCPMGHSHAIYNATDKPVQ